MSRTEDGAPDPLSGRVRARDVGPRASGRPKPDQPLRARWDPTDDTGRPRVDREGQPERKKQSALGRFVSTYGWRAYAIPVLIVQGSEDTVTPPANGERLQATAPERASVKSLEGADHFFPVTHPIETAVIIEEYLDWD